MKKIVILSMTVLLGLFIFLTRVQAENIKYIRNFDINRDFGNIRQEIVLNEKSYLAVSTNKHLYLLENKQISVELNIEKVKFIEVIEDLNENGYEELLVITDSYDDNIIVYDTKNYQLLSSYASTMHAYNLDEMRERPTGYYNEIVNVEDYVLDGKYLYAVAAYNVFSYDLETGKELWNYEAEDNLWSIELISDIDNDNRKDVVVSLQASDIITFSGAKGKILYQKHVSESEKTKQKETYNTSIWNMVYDSESDILFASSENGKIYKINPDNGKVTEKKEIAEVEIDIYYYDAVHNDKDFKAYTIELIDDITGDGINDLIYYQYLKPYSYISYYNYEIEMEMSINLIDGKTLSIIDKIVLNDDGYGFYYYRGEYDGLDVFYIYDGHKDSNRIFKIYDIKNKKYLEETLEIRTINNYGSITVHSIIVLENQEVVLFTNGGLIFQKNLENLKEIPFLILEDYIIQDNYMLLIEEGHSGYYSLVLSDITTDEVLWTYDHDANYRVSQIDFSYDYNDDGVIDIVLIGRSSNVHPYPWLMLIDGKTGEGENIVDVILNRDEIIYEGDFNEYLSSLGYDDNYIINYGSYHDLNQDGINEYFVSTYLGELYFVDIKNGEIIDYFSPVKDIKYRNASHYIDFNFRNIFKTADIDNDLKEDFVSFSSGEVNTDLNLYKIKTNDFAFIFENSKYSYSMYDIISDFGDIDQDGINDMAVLMSDKFKTQYLIISSKTGDVLKSMEVSSSDSLIYLNDEDINNDGYKEVIQVAREEGRRSYDLRIEIVDIINEEKLFTYSKEYVYQLAKAAAVFKDNGKYYVVIHHVRRYSHNTLLIYDLENNNLIDEITIGMINKDYYATSVFDNINVIYANDTIYFYNRAGHEHDYQYNKPFVYDYKAKEVYFYFSNASIKHLDIIGDKLFLKTAFYEVIKTEIDDHIKIANLKNNQKISRTKTITFADKKDGDVYIYVDGELDGITSDDSYDLKLLEGHHTITISQITKSGIERVDTVDVVVVHNNYYIIFVLVLSFTSLLGLILIPHRKRKFPVSVTEGSEK